MSIWPPYFDARYRVLCITRHAGGIVETSVASGFSKSCWKRYINIIYTICKQRIVTKICPSPST